MKKNIYIYFDDAYTEKAVMVGLLSAQQIRGHEVFSFEFTDEWLHDNHCHLLDPDLQLFSGRQYLPEEKSNFGIFLDSSPDRWGRILLDRRESHRAREERRDAVNLQESDYLLGVFDESRMGALRMKLSPDYDLNPSEYGEGLSLNITEHDNALDYALALEIAPFAGISENIAKQIIQHTKDVVSQWRSLAMSYHISRDEQEILAKAFRVR